MIGICSADGYNIFTFRLFRFSVIVLISMICFYELFFPSSPYRLAAELKYAAVPVSALVLTVSAATPPRRRWPDFEPARPARQEASAGKLAGRTGWRFRWADGNRRPSLIALLFGRSLRFASSLKKRRQPKPRRRPDVSRRPRQPWRLSGNSGILVAGAEAQSSPRPCLVYWSPAPRDGRHRP